MNVDEKNCTIMMVYDSKSSTNSEAGTWRREVLDGNLMLTLELNGRPYFSIRYPTDAGYNFPSDSYLNELTEQWDEQLSPGNYSFVAALICRVGLLEEQLQFLTQTLLDSGIEVKGKDNGQVRTFEAKEDQELPDSEGTPEADDVKGSG